MICSIQKNQPEANSLMWGNKKKKHQIDTIIAKGTQVEGDFNIKGNLFIDGDIKGDIRSDNDQSAVVSIGLNGNVSGDLHAPYIVIFGHVKGDVHASQKVELKPGAKVDGDLHYRVIEMNAGSEVNGKMIATGEPKQIEHITEESIATTDKLSVDDSTARVEEEFNEKPSEENGNSYNVAKASGISS